MPEVLRHPAFIEWLEALRDVRARDRITARTQRLALGNPGDVKTVGEGISEMRIDYGPGYRVYFKQRGSALIILLCGGDKSSQEQDISRAKELVRELGSI
ncbi:type II toxin-antitoxin system RelE/ParE family toxin [Methylobacterium iners]|uniref:Addiction module antitoxin RelB n=1 Tax=Methylobacterium iners TaxID=418707 RepID=A0ABQ4RTP1_9HYPH|nr:type II toxin-antitoxin system RelE/ParE family toxin [Methylobacterium iners]GJD94156.1 hypothetical protein OCOJLMKI_1358 [Methylobacterium iners]